MRRSLPFLLCTCLCALATGLTVVALAKDVNHPSSPVPGRSAEAAAANVDLVRRFYADAAMVLATGDADLLDATVAPDLIEHPARPGSAAGRDGFVRSMLALRATFPGVRLVVDDVRAAGADQVLARVHAVRGESGDFLGRPAPASSGQWGPLDVWRLADGQLVERWGSLEPVTLLPLGQAPISVDTLGPGHRRVTVTRMTIEPGAWLPVDNGQAIRVFAVDTGTLTLEVAARSSGTVAVGRGSAVPDVRRPGTTIAAKTGDRIVTTPEANYTLANAGSSPVVALVVIVSNTLVVDYPRSSAAAAASWTVAAMPEALGGALPSPDGVSAHVLVVDVEIELPERPILALGWMFLMPGAALALPAGDGMLLAMVDAGEVDLAATGNITAATLGGGEWRLVAGGAGSLWQAGNEAPAIVLVLSMGEEATTA